MPIPQRCFTCGKAMQDNYITKYIPALEQYTDEMSSNPDKFMVEINGSKVMLSPQFFALKDLGIWRECCRKMYIATHCIDDEIH